MLLMIAHTHTNPKEFALTLTTGFVTTYEFAPSATVAEEAHGAYPPSPSLSLSSASIPLPSTAENEKKKLAWRIRI